MLVGTVPDMQKGPALILEIADRNLPNEIFNLFTATQDDHDVIDGHHSMLGARRDIALVLRPLAFFKTETMEDTRRCILSIATAKNPHSLFIHHLSKKKKRDA